MKNKIYTITLLVAGLLAFPFTTQALEKNNTDIENGSYVIGTHEYTEDYGHMSTQTYMLASKTISSSLKDDMIIYYKNLSGNWINAITGKSIEAPVTFTIHYIDEVAENQDNNTELLKSMELEYSETDYLEEGYKRYLEAVHNGTKEFYGKDSKYKTVEEHIEAIVISKEYLIPKGYKENTIDELLTKLNKYQEADFKAEDWTLYTTKLNNFNDLLANLKDVKFTQLEKEFNDLEEYSLNMHPTNFEEYLTVLKEAKKYLDNMGNYNTQAIEELKFIYEIYNDHKNFNNTVKAYNNAISKLQQKIDKIIELEKSLKVSKEQANKVLEYSKNIDNKIKEALNFDEVFSLVIEKSYNETYAEFIKNYKTFEKNPSDITAEELDLSNVATYNHLINVLEAYANYGFLIEDDVTYSPKSIEAFMDVIYDYLENSNSFRTFEEHDSYYSNLKTKFDGLEYDLSILKLNEVAAIDEEIRTKFKDVENIDFATDSFFAFIDAEKTYNATSKTLKEKLDNLWVIENSPELSEYYSNVAMEHLQNALNIYYTFYLLIDDGTIYTLESWNAYDVLEDEFYNLSDKTELKEATYDECMELYNKFKSAYDNLELA